MSYNVIYLYTKNKGIKKMDILKLKEGVLTKMNITKGDGINLSGLLLLVLAIKFFFFDKFKKKAKIRKRNKN